MKPFSKYFFIIFFCDTLFILPTILTVECFYTFGCYFFLFFSFLLARLPTFYVIGIMRGCTYITIMRFKALFRRFKAM